MMKEALVLWEVSKKQSYIFASNKLKENKGASKIVEDVMEELPGEKYSGNLVYNGGGSSLYKFKDRQSAKLFIGDVSRRVLEKYPGVEVFMVIEDYDGKEDVIIDVIGRAYEKLGHKKGARRHSGQQHSFGIERICESTGLPASDFYEDEGQKRYISDVIGAKRRESENVIKKFKDLIPYRTDKNGIKEFRQLAKGEKNYLAIIHIDGNKMGVKIGKLQQAFRSRYESGEERAKLNTEYIEALKSFSDKIKAVYEGAFKEIGRVMELNRENLSEFTQIEEGAFPLIPIILAGDDITYATNGKIAVETAKVFLEHLQKLNGSDGIEIYPGIKEPFNACAGVAIAPVSYPFAKTYEMAEELCDSAKARIRSDHPSDEEADYSLIDWHIEQGDTVGSIEEIRSTFYKSLDEQALTMKPLYLNKSKDFEGKSILNTYENFQRSFDSITRPLGDGERKEAALARNKLKKMRDILKKGESETELFIRANKLENYFTDINYFDGITDLSGETAKYCFKGGVCMYYDAIEAIDIYERLKREDEIDE